MIKHICTIFLFFIPCVFAHTADTLYADTLFFVSDSVKTVTTDTTFVIDSLTTLQKIQPDTLVPISVRNLSEESTIIGRKTFLFTPYRYTGDLLRPFALNFTKDLGFIGQPYETFIYGVGNRGISYLQDGVLWNNRFTNSLDLNLVQSEDIDSVEIVPSPRGFLYGPYNNPVAVNFIMRDFLSPEPYTRIRYYEGPNGEAMIDGKFNAQIAKRWNLSFQVTNRSVNETYKNTDLSIWQANVKLKYFLSNSVNITGLYTYVNSSIGLNGGIDIDSVNNLTNDINSVIYDPQQAPVVYPNRIKDVLQHNAGLRLQVLPFKEAKLNLSFYYRYLDCKMDDVKDSIDLYENYDNKVLGGMLMYDHKIDWINVKLIGTYEKLEENYSTFRYPELQGSQSIKDNNRFSITSIISFNLFSNNLIPSVYYKYLNVDNNEDIILWGVPLNYDKSESFTGFGADIAFRIDDELFSYFGYSRYKQFADSADVESIEIGARYRSDHIYADAKYFKRANTYIVPLDIQHSHIPLPGNVNGAGIVLNYQYWKILIETNTSYYFNDNDVIGVPELQFVGGIYLKSKLFDDNLNLKSGFTFYYTGKRNSYSGEWGFVEVDPSNKIDFILIGEIQELAIVYFVWENLFDNQYYITPYYPMPERSIRFGLSWELFN